MDSYKIFSGGEWLESARLLQVRNKYNGEIFAHTWQADTGILNSSIEAAVRVKDDCASMPSYMKERILLQIAEGIMKKKEGLSRLLSMESAKPIIYAGIEIERAAQVFRIAAEECKRLPKEYLSLDWTENGKGKEGLVKHFPAGIVAGISPFNFPMNLAVHKVAPAIAAGCPIILKPASSTPLSTLALARIIEGTDLPKGALSILPMDRETGNGLVTDERIHVLSFTGSPEVGWEMKKRAGKKKVILELGGNAGVIICKGTNVKEVVNLCLAGAFAYSGQICIHAQRFYVHDSVFDGFVTEMVKGAQSLKVGDPLNEDTRMSHMIDEENAIRVENWVKDALADGAKIMCGGKRSGSYFEPTIITSTTSAMKVNCEEVFGPVITIERFEGEVMQAVKKVNEGKFGLQCGVFTDSVKELDTVFENVECGGVIHNNVPTLRFDHMPYGGVKESGLGREGVRYAIADMMEAKILVK